jgi:hypothetical protein
MNLPMMERLGQFLLIHICDAWLMNMKKIAQVGKQLKKKLVLPLASRSRPELYASPELDEK